MLDALAVATPGGSIALNPPQNRFSLFLNLDDSGNFFQVPMLFVTIVKAKFVTIVNSSWLCG
jgi:hypothetical protein